MPNDAITGNVRVQDITAGIADNSGTISANVGADSGSISTVITPEEGMVTGSLGTTSTPLNASISSDTQSFAASLTVSYGADGKPGKDGFSPTISVYEETEQSYILQITDVNGSYLTPNLKGTGSIVVDGFVVETLNKYPEIDPMTLNATELENTYLYIHRDDTGANRKVAMSSIALEESVADRFRTKIRTVEERPDEDWRVGDYIFLETGDGE